LLPINEVYNIDCLDGLELLDNNCVDLVITSPPYDKMRENKYDVLEVEKFKKIAEQLYRVIKVGGVVIWVVGDSTENGNETGTSFRQALYFKEIGFNLHDTMIYKKNSYIPQTIIGMNKNLNICLYLAKRSLKHSIL
jgi:DNA modification methylase